MLLAIQKILAFCGVKFITAVKSFMIQATGINVIKLFTAVIYKLSKARMLFPGKLLQPSLMLESKARTYPKPTEVKHLSGARF
jgi:hypothetical protein